MATTTADVTREGLTLNPETMASLGLCPGSRVSVTIDRESIPTLHPDAERLAAATMGMFAHGPSLSEALKEWRQEDEQRAGW